MEWSALDPSRPVWIEAESRQVGRCRVPEELFSQMMQASVLQVKRSRPERVANLLEDYGDADRDGLIAATERLRKKLGGLRTQEAIAHIQAGDLSPAIDMVLDYYDKTYTYDLNKKRDVPIYPLDIEGLSPDEAAQALRNKATSLLPRLH